MRLRCVTAGESHGDALVAILEGLPAGLMVDRAAVDAALARRQRGHGRGGRMRIEHDVVEIPAGLRAGRTLGSPLLLVVRNRDATLERLPAVTRPRPGHADLAGMLRWGTRDARDVLERASARSTAVTTAAGAVAALLLAEAGVRVVGWCSAVGGVEAGPAAEDLDALVAARDASAFLCPDPAVEDAMRAAVDAARAAGDTVGGVVEVRAVGVPPGLGSCATAGERLDGRLAAALMAIPAVKGVEIGLGFAAARMRGSAVHDAVLPPPAAGAPPARGSNRAGGVEGGMSNGEPVVVRAAMKPLSSLRGPLPSVDAVTGAPAPAATQRSDVCAVPALSVVAEAAVALVLADALLDRAGGETVDEFRARVAACRAAAASVFPYVGGTS